MTVDGELHARLPRAVESAGFFVASEAVTNALKHADATRVDIRTWIDNGQLRLTVRDDGRGGADPSGPGLTGLASRVAALNGRLAIESPAGGPPTIHLEVPCV